MTEEEFDFDGEFDEFVTRTGAEKLKQIQQLIQEEQHSSEASDSDDAVAQ